ncbi:SurA N-terminal domain-containing protein [Salinicola salarius]|uniref:SurA N-terminal domain-containing protein n=1 Tax=Salinicola salarius TaxID=430457 RepID=UPI0023E3FF2D|nr:SurA N-terminal domain-containing protein [Salinicola salarius]MDF3917270.1 SurA N-terminal domain-containing protein [Salinicola salarius]
MLQRIREGSQGWVAKVIVGAIIVTFALFGAESLVSYFSAGSNDAATVNGESINRQAVETQVQRGIRSGQVPPEQERQFRGQVLDQLIRQRTLDQYASEGGLHISDSQLDRLIVSLPEFQDQDGRFSDELFTNRLAQAGYTPASFRRELRADTLRRQVQQGLAASAFLLPSEKARLASLQQQQRTFRYAALTAADLEQPVTPSDADLQQYYDQHQDDFLRPEQVKVNYLVLNQEDVAKDVEVTDEQLRQAYEQAKAAAPREVSHILVTFGDDRTEQEARDRIAEVQQQLEQGADFTALAREYSDDSSSAGDGGDLGAIQKGFFGDSFDNAAFSLDPGQVSQVVQTQYGLHLIKVTGIDIPSFEEDREALTRQVKLEQSESLFNERVQKLTDDAYEADDLATVAGEMGLTVQTSDWFSQDVGGEGVLSNPDAAAAAFSSDVLEDGYNSDVIETDDQQRVVLRVVDHREASTLPLDEVRDQVLAAVKIEQTRQQLQKRAEEVLATLRNGDVVSGLDWQQADSVTRDADSVPAPILQEAFRLSRPQADAVTWGQTESQNGVAIVGLESVTAGDTSSDDADFVTRLAQRLQAQIAIQGLSQTLEEEADVERH